MVFQSNVGISYSNYFIFWLSKLLDYICSDENLSALETVFFAQIIGFWGKVLDLNFRK